jgi:hypothetical protein
MLRSASRQPCPGGYGKRDDVSAVAELMVDLAGDAEVIIDFAGGGGNILRTTANRALEHGAPATCYGQDASKTQARIIRPQGGANGAGLRPGVDPADPLGVAAGRPVGHG